MSNYHFIKVVIVIDAENQVDNDIKNFNDALNIGNIDNIEVIEINVQCTEVLRDQLYAMI